MARRLGPCNRRCNCSYHQIHNIQLHNQPVHTQENWRGLNLQFVKLLEPLGEKVFKGHNEHVASEISASSVEYFPAIHDLHDDDPLVS